MQLYNSQQWKIPWNIQSVEKQKHVGVNEERVEREYDDQIPFGGL